MHENKFEKQVSEKMDQLGFDPSDAVWARVDQEINQGKRKRRPLFWIFFFSGLLLGAAGVYMIMKLNSPANTKTISSENLSGDDHKAVPANSSNDEISDRKETSKNHQPLTPVSSNLPVKYKHQEVAKYPVNKQISASGNIELNKGRVITPENNMVIEKDKQQNTSEDAESRIQKPLMDNKTMVTAIPVIAESNVQNTNKPLSKDSASQSADVGKKKAKASPWSLVFNATAGFSNMNQSLFQPVNTNSQYYLYTPANSSTGAAQIPGTYLSSDIQAGFSFGAGIMVKRKMSKKVSLMAGLDYHYYSTKIHTGKSIDSPRFAYAANGRAAFVNSYFQGGQSEAYTNQYHYIGIPVSVSLQLNKSNSHPINWEAGFSLSWLVGSNALQFDPGDNIYFKNNQLINKTQWNATTAVMVGFPVHKHSIQLGPQLDYGLSGLLNSNTVNPGHLFYLGIKCSFIP